MEKCKNCWHKKGDDICCLNEKLEKQTKIKNDLYTAKEFFLKNNFEYFTPEQLNVIGKTMCDYANYIKAE